ncbi:class I SAM-dependent methyltransferase [Actinokineospora xionganensis]|uniref:Methyltransferase domain-containing protein n=1 Tax=Actinokineospora xionganensis TaxID=2684470 RepID=A0ABR7L5I3_9PSEU|nr:methyltransferase domain-containing protein [Actinokineospora xionganensis]MBC6447651.1 methyltransferase domain-containing protein [Actinokineospora xionganensis]
MTVQGVEFLPESRRDWQDTPAARRRHAVTEANLTRHLDGPQRILDAAGGTGRDAVRLALRGHDVTVLDPAGAMLTAAMACADDHGVADRVHVVQAMAEDAPELFGPHDFDVVLCHNLLQFADDRVGLLRALTAPLREGGLLSVVGPASGALFVCPASDVLDDLRTAGAEVLAHYGVDVQSGHPLSYFQIIARNV